MPSFIENADASLTAGVSDPVSLKVLTFHPSPQYQSILKGVVFQKDAASANVTLRSEYRSLAYLFNLVPKIAPVAGLLFKDLSFPTEKVARQFVANCIDQSARHWAKMYENVGLQSLAAGPAMMTEQMLNAERDNVNGAVRGYLSGLDLQRYDVSVTFEAILAENPHGEPIGALSAEQLFKEVTINPHSFQINATQSEPPQVEAAADEGREHLPADAQAHDGAVELSMQGYVTVLASSQENALLIASALTQAPSANNWAAKQGWWQADESGHQSNKNPRLVSYDLIPRETLSDKDDEDDESDQGGGTDSDRGHRY